MQKSECRRSCSRANERTAKRIGLTSTYSFLLCEVPGMCFCHDVTRREMASFYAKKNDVKVTGVPAAM